MSKVSIEMILYYQRIGLIPTAYINENGSHIYTHVDVCRLDFIRSARESGFSICEIKELFDLNPNVSYENFDVESIVHEYAIDLDNKIDRMLGKVEALKSLYLLI